MITFDQFRVSEDSKRILIDVHVSEVPYADGILISKVTLCTDEQLTSPHPTTYGEDYIYQYVPEVPQEEVHLEIDANDTNEKFNKQNFSSNLFYLFIEWTGEPAEVPPCGADTNPELAVTYDTVAINHSAMGYTKQLVNTCEIPMGFMDFIFQKNALDISLKTCHYESALTFWKLLTDNKAVSNAKRCGCHG